MATVELRFSALPEHVRTARLISVVMARRSGIDVDLVDEVRLAVGEACSRAVALHQAHAPDEMVTVEFNDDDGRFTACVRDGGPRTADGGEGSFAAVATSLAAGPADNGLADTGEMVALVDSAPELERAGSVQPSDGFGLAVIAGLVDEFSVVHSPDGAAGTVVRMVWPRGTWRMSRVPWNFGGGPLIVRPR